MIDWAGLGTNTLWIMGLAVILTALSHAHWLAREQGVRFRSILRPPTRQVPFDLAACRRTL